MAGFWEVILPETDGQINLVTNPSIETATTGFTAVGGSAAQIATLGNQRRGAYGLRVIPTSGVNDGVYYGNVSLSDGELYYFSFDFKGSAGQPYQAYFANTSGTKQGTETTWTATGDWERISVSYTASGTANRRLYILKNNDANTDAFIIDGLLVNTNKDDVLLDYFDGDSPGCVWNGTEHASTSTSDPQERKVGYAVNLDTYEFYVESLEGLGMIPARHRAQYLSGVAGAVYRGSKVQPRQFVLTGGVQSTSLSGLHSNRKSIIDAIKHDLVAGDKPFILRTTHANSDRPLDIEVVADIELGRLTSNPVWQDLAVRLIAYDPYFYEIGNEGQSLIENVEGNTYRYYVSKVSGQWSDETPSAVTDPGSGIRVSAILKEKSTGNVYVGGEFLNWDAIANADYIAYLDADGAWNALGTGANGEVICLALGPDGTLYAGGSFTSIGGTAANYIASWNGASWSALGSGMNGSVTNIQFAQDGTLYACGAFTNAGGGAAAYIASWDGSAWAALGSGLGNAGQEIAIAPNGDVYVCGQFTTAGGSSANYVAMWDGSSWSALGTGANAACLALRFGADGLLYLGGTFTTADGNSAAGIAAWNGQTWSALGSGLTGGDCYTIAVDDDGMVYAGGDFTAAGGLTLTASLAIWNGYSWVHPDLYLPGHGTSIVYGISLDGDDIYVGFDGVGSQSTSYVNSGVTNSGTARSYPKIEINRSGGTSARLMHIWNVTTDKRMFFDYSLLDGETLTIECDERNRSIMSNFFGKVTRAMLRGSDFADFFLLPGDNDILVYAYGAGTPTITVNMTWPIRHESIDGTAA